MQDGVPGLADALACVTCRPAAILGVPHGTLAPGTAADVCVFDPTERWCPAPETWRSRGRDTPFFGAELTGRVRCTLFGGWVVFER